VEGIAGTATATALLSSAMRRSANHIKARHGRPQASPRKEDRRRIRVIVFVLVILVVTTPFFHTAEMPSWDICYVASTATAVERLKACGNVDTGKYAGVDGYVLHGSPVFTPRTLHNMDSNPTTSKCFDADLDDSADGLSTTLVTQTSLDRVWVLRETCRRWNVDPIVAVVAMKPHQTGWDLAKALRYGGIECKNLTLIEYYITADQAKPENDPLNHLRNVGLDAVRTSHAIVLDIDLVPSEGLDRIIKATLNQREALRRRSSSGSMAAQDNEALVIPVFEKDPPPLCNGTGSVSNKYCSEYQDYMWLERDPSFIPRNFTELKMCLNEASCEIVCKYTNFHGHSSTRTEDWLMGKWYEDQFSDDVEGNSSKPAAAMNGPRNIRSVKCLETDHAAWEWVRNPTEQHYIDAIASTHSFSHTDNVSCAFSLCRFKGLGAVCCPSLVP